MTMYKTRMTSHIRTFPKIKVIKLTSSIKGLQITCSLDKMLVAVSRILPIPICTIQVGVMFKRFRAMFHILIALHQSNLPLNIQLTLVSKLRLTCKNK